MMSEEEVESWYEEEKRGLLEKYMAAIEAKEHTEEAEKKYTKNLSALFESYKKRRVKLMEDSTKKAREAAKKRVEQKPTGAKAIAARLAALLKREKK